MFDQQDKDVATGIGIGILIVAVIILFSGCGGGYRSAMTPLDPPPIMQGAAVVKESLTTELHDAEKKTIWQTVKPVLYYGTVGH